MAYNFPNKIIQFDSYEKFVTELQETKHGIIRLCDIAYPKLAQHGIRYDYHVVFASATDTATGDLLVLNALFGVAGTIAGKDLEPKDEGRSKALFNHGETAVRILTDMLTDSVPGSIIRGGYVTTALTYGQVIFANTDELRMKGDK